MPSWKLSGALVLVLNLPTATGTPTGRVLAEQLGSDAGPLVCVDGRPGVAATTLLRSLAEQGASLRQHGDLDWGGLRIGNLVFGRLPAVPWRFDADAYRRAAALGGGHPLTGEPTTCGWDPTSTRRCGRSDGRWRRNVCSTISSTTSQIPPGPAMSPGRRRGLFLRACRPVRHGGGSRCPPSSRRPSATSTGTGPRPSHGRGSRRR